MRVENRHRITLKMMLFIVLAQIFVPTVYKAAEVNDQTLTKFATYEDFTSNEESKEFAFEFYADEEVAINFKYDESAAIKDYNYLLNEKQLDLDQSTTVKIGENKLVIKTLAEDAGDISSLELLLTKADLKHVSKPESEIAQDDTTSEVSSATIEQAAENSAANSKIKAYIQENQEIVNVTTPQNFELNSEDVSEDTSSVRFGETQTLEILVLNTLTESQNVTYSNWEMSNYTEDGSEFTEAEDGEAPKTQDRKLTTSDFENSINSNKRSTVSVEVTPINPAESTKTKQLYYAKDPDALEVSFSNDLTFQGNDGITVPVSIKQKLTGDDATLTGEDVLYTSNDINNQTEIMEWVLEQFTASDPNAPALSLSDFRGTNNTSTGNVRVDWQNYQVLVDEKIATATVRLRGLNNVWVTKDVTIISGPANPSAELTFMGAKYGGNFAETDDELTWEIDYVNNNTVKTGVRFAVYLDDDDIAGNIYDVEIIKNGDVKLVEGVDYVVRNNDIEFITNVESFETVKIKYKQKTVSEFVSESSIFTYLTISADDVDDVVVIPAVDVEKEPIGTHKLTIENVVDDQDANGRAGLGEKLTYTIAVTNTGRSDETNVNILNAVDDSNYDLSTLELISVETLRGASITSSSLDSTNGLEVVADIDKGGVVTVKYSVNIKSSGIKNLTSFFTRGFSSNIKNTVTVSSDGVRKPVTVIKSIPIDKDAPGLVDLALTKSLVSTTDGDMLADTDENLNFELKVANNGAAIQENVVLKDQPSGEIDRELTNIVVKKGTQTLSEGTDYFYTQEEDEGVFSFAQIDSGEEITITYSIKTANVFYGRDPLKNKVTANSIELDEPVSTEVEIEQDFSRNVVIVASDKDVKLSDAPKTEVELLKLLEAYAVDRDGEDFTNRIEVVDLGGYNYLNSKTGRYEMTLKVQGSDNQFSETNVLLHISSDTESIDTANIYLNTPLYILKGSGETAADVINNYAKPVFVEMSTTSEQYVNLNEESIVSDAGYANDKVGMYPFKIAYSRYDRSIEVEQVIHVYVVESRDEVVNSAEINGNDITILKRSPYESYESRLHASDNNTTVTALTTKNGIEDHVPLTADNIAYTNVETSVVGDYVTTFAYANNESFSTPVKATKSFAVHVVGENEKTNASISAGYKTLHVQNAPKNESELLTALNAQAAEANGDDITDKIKIIDLGGYNFTTPTTGKFTLKLSVVGSDGVIVTTDTELRIISNDLNPYSISISATNPIVIPKGSTVDAGDVVEDYANPIVLETMNKIDEPGYALGRESLVYDSGFNTSENGTYTFKLETYGEKTADLASTLIKVIVTDDPTTVQAYATINGQDIKVLEGSKYNEALAATLHANNYAKVTAEVSEKGTIKTIDLDETNLMVTDVDTEVAGEYSTTFSYIDASSYEAPVSAVKTYKVTVVEANEATNAVISATDANINLSKAPTSEEAVISTLSGKSTEANGKDLTETIKVDDLGGYNLSAPEVGGFTIQLSVIGADGVKVTTTAVLDVVADGAKTNSIAMSATNPIVVLNGEIQNATDVIDTYANAMVIETIDGTVLPAYAVGSETIVSDGGYDFETNGTYSFKLQAKGLVSELNVSTIVTVIVTENPATAKAYATIDGQDIKVLEGSKYNEELAATLHAKTYAKVTAEVSEAGSFTPVTLDGSNVMVTNVDTAVVGEYSTTFSFSDANSYTAPITAVKTYKVIVVETEDPGTVDAYATIDGQDIKVLQGSFYNNDISVVLHANEYAKVSAVVSELGATTDVALTGSNVVESSVNTNLAGEYKTTYAYNDKDSFAAPVTALETFNVEVVEVEDATNAKISATDAEVNLNEAPTTKQDLITMFKADAVSATGTNMTNQISIVDLNGYDFAEPTTGNFEITIGIVGEDGVLITADANLKVYDAEDATNDINMFVTTPVVVELGSGMDVDTVINTLVYPTIVETIDGVDQGGYLLNKSSLVSDGGYDNNTAGTYFFKLKATGNKTELESEELVKVIVADNPDSVEAYAKLNGSDIKLLAGNKYNRKNVTKLHANTNGEITVEVVQNGVVKEVPLDGTNAIATTVDTSSEGNYGTLFHYKEAIATSRSRTISQNISVADKVEIVSPLMVDVLNVDDGGKYVEFTKSVKSQDGKKIVSDNGVLDYTINIKNTSSDIVYNELDLLDELLNSELNANNITKLSIFDKDGNDVTPEFDVQIDNGLKINIDLLRPSDELTITFSIKLDDNVTEYEIDNTATLTFDEKSKNSNKASINTDYSADTNEKTPEKESGRLTPMTIVNTGANIVMFIVILLILLVIIIIVRKKRAEK